MLIHIFFLSLFPMVYMYYNMIIIIGKNENQRQTAVRNKRQGKASKLSDRLRVQIDKLGVAKSKF